MLLLKLSPLVVVCTGIERNVSCIWKRHFKLKPMPKPKPKPEANVDFQVSFFFYSKFRSQSAYPTFAVIRCSPKEARRGRNIEGDKGNSLWVWAMSKVEIEVGNLCVRSTMSPELRRKYVPTSQSVVGSLHGTVHVFPVQLEVRYEEVVALHSVVSLVTTGTVRNTRMISSLMSQL